MKLKRLQFSLRALVVAVAVLGMSLGITRWAMRRWSVDNLFNVIVKGRNVVSEGSAFYAILEFPDIDEAANTVRKYGMSNEAARQIIPLAHQDENLRCRAARALGQLAPFSPVVESEVRASLLKLSSDVDPYTKEEAMRSLKMVDK